MQVTNCCRDVVVSCREGRLRCKNASLMGSFKRLECRATARTVDTHRCKDGGRRFSNNPRIPSGGPTTNRTLNRTKYIQPYPGASTLPMVFKLHGSSNNTITSRECTKQGLTTTSLQQSSTTTSNTSSHTHTLARSHAPSLPLSLRVSHGCR